MDIYTQGYQDTLVRFGIQKISAPVGPAKSVLSRVGGWLKSKLPTARGLRQGAIGSPLRFRDELVSGRALRKGSLIRESFHAPTMMSKALFYGLPAVEAGSIAMDDQGNKAQRIGGSIGGAALGLGAWRPLGMVGSMAAGTLGHRLGSGIGKTVGQIGSKPPTTEQQDEIPPVNNAWGSQ